jgi:hypothetical protein
MSKLRLLTRNILLGLAVVAVVGSAAFAQENALQTIREDVRQGAPSSPAPAADTTADRGSEARHSSSDSDLESNLYAEAMLGIAYVGAVTVTSPLWVPHYWLQDDLSQNGYFLHFPYDGGDGYIWTGDWVEGTRPVAVRLDIEYIDTFDRLDIVDGHLLLDTPFRFGLAASFEHLEERLRNGGRDALQIGDCNLVYRFAQGEWAEFRTGLGLNWLNDSDRTDLGFNFIYAFDLYPRKPWVLSTTIDWGTLGHAGLFRFRTTAGVVFHGIETYAGYEYTDIERTHWNGLVAGLRFWF